MKPKYAYEKCVGTKFLKYNKNRELIYLIAKILVTKNFILEFVLINYSSGFSRTRPKRFKVLSYEKYFKNMSWYDTYVTYVSYHGVFLGNS
jgi:hypothetical protein